ncbi:hypothetical protein [Bradyrhizobium sp. JYMT SZCCT0180]|uniref:hypothetical protein n=1 Tax=Bradyrhizobium sp. JYMT SZCCT0180 TaxID=2807666 RepID=UPI001BAAC139|nr:hypothetical protein [Bradyrhizobium sp. JYMT SZCCT0180]MBR1216160.1 hypothetical protein [Bradyrhizobium sp. JYMT SZCCT0180]
MTEIDSAERGGLAQQVLELAENLSIGLGFGKRTDVAVATFDRPEPGKTLFE